MFPRWAACALLLVAPAQASAAVHLRAPSQRAAGVRLPLSLSGAPANATVALERRTSRGRWFGIKAVKTDARGRGRTTIGTPVKARSLRLRIRAGEAHSNVARTQVRLVTLTSVGDINLGDGVGDVMAARGPKWPWTGVAPLLRRADIAFGNLECPVSRRGTAVVKQYTFRGNPAYLKTLRSYAGLDVVNLANNHTGDYGTAALADTVRYVRATGLTGVGAGLNLAGARRPQVVERLGLKVAFVAFSDIGPYEFAAGQSTPGTRLAASENIRADIAAARKLGDVVIASFHWGVERDPKPSARQAQFAREALAAGATAVIGAHPHVLQPVTHPAPHRVVAYSLGNFVWSAGSGATARTGLLTLSLSTAGVEATRFTPATIVGTRPQLR